MFVGNAAGLASLQRTNTNIYRQNTQNVQNAQKAVNLPSVPAVNGEPKSPANSAVTLDLSDRAKLRAAVAMQSAANDGAASVRAEESAMDEIQSNLEKLTALASQAADTNEDVDRDGLQSEAEELQADISRMADMAGGSTAVYSMQPAMYAAAGTPAIASEAPAARSIPAVSGDMISHPWQDETYAATWTGTVDPSKIEAGSRISINGITVEFVSDGSWTGGGVPPAGWDEASPLQIDIQDIKTGGASDGDKAQAIASRFASVINNDTVTSAIIDKAGWTLANNELDNEINNDPAFCQWTNDGSTWTLTLTQPEKYANEGDAFAVEISNPASMAGTSSSHGTTSSKEYSVLYGVGGDTLKAGCVLQIGDAQIVVKAASADGPAAGTFAWNEGSGKKNGVIYVDSSNVRDSLTDGLEAALHDTVGGNCQVEITKTFPPAGKTGNWFNIRLETDKSPDASKSLLPELNVMPDVADSSLKAADEATPAYIQYKVDLNKLKDGDTFKFGSMRFVLDTNSDTSQPPVSMSGDEAVAHVSAGDARTAIEKFEKLFNQYFQEKSTGPSVSGSGGGAKGSALSSNTQWAFKSKFALIKAGAFQMKIDIDGNNIATVNIFATTKDVLNEAMEIELEEGDGWRSAEGTGEGGEADAAEGTSENGENGEADPAAETAEGEALAQAEANAQAMAAGLAPVQAAAMTPEGLGIDGMDIRTPEGAEEALSALSAASDTVSASQDALAGTKKEVKTAGESTGTLTDSKGEIRQADEAEKALKDTEEQAAQAPEEALQAQAANLDSQAVNQLTAA